MGFFDLPAEPDEPGDDQEDWHYDDGTSPWVPGVVPLELVLARNDRAAVILNFVSVFPDAFEFNLEAAIRWSVRLPRDSEPFGAHVHFRRRDPLPEEFLRFGLEWPDGGRATNLDQSWRHAPDATQPQHVLGGGSAGGSQREYQWEYWASPVPRKGDMRAYVQWPAYGIDDVSVVIEGDSLRAASGRARRVWEADVDRSRRLRHSGMVARMDAGRGDSDEDVDEND